MQHYSTTEARKNLSEIINKVKYEKIVVSIGRHNKQEVLITPKPELNEEDLPISDINSASPSFNFLKDEPDLYSLKDLKNAMYKFGTIALIPFPFTDLTSTKLRPALIISKTSTKEDIIVAFITTNLTKSKNSFTLKPSDPHFKQTGLKAASTFRFNKIATLHKKLILGELGTLHKETLNKMKPIFQGPFGF